MKNESDGMDGRDVTWSEMPCGIPGYEVTAGLYASHIRELVNRGEYMSAFVYLKEAREAGQMHRLEKAHDEHVQTQRAFLKGMGGK